MDLFAPCRSCLQCLPFFQPSSPARVTAPSPSPHSSDASNATSLDPAQATPAAAPAVQEQDLCPPLKAEEVQPQDAYSAITECEAVPASGIVIAPPVTSPHSSPLPSEDVDDDIATNLPEIPMHVPFINDITFSTSGSLPGQSPVTPAPFGPGYPSHPYPPPQYQIAHDQRIGHAQHGHGDPHHSVEKPCHDDASVQLEHSHSHHGHGHSHHGHVNSGDGHVSPQYQIAHGQHIAGAEHEHSHLHHGHGHSHHGHVNSEDLHVSQHSHTADYEAPHPDTPSHDSQAVQELHKDARRHDSHQQGHVSASVDEVGELATEHTSFDDKMGHISPTPNLEVSQSTPELDLEVNVGGENSAGSHTNGVPAVLETYYSEPVVAAPGNPYDIDDVESPSELVGHGGSHFPARRRRRDYFKDNLKGFKQQVKQGGLHLKEEGSKHMQTIIENMNKQAQQIEQSGSFFMVPRANNN